MWITVNVQEQCVGKLSLTRVAVAVVGNSTKRRKPNIGTVTLLNLPDIGFISNVPSFATNATNPLVGAVIETAPDADQSSIAVMTGPLTPDFFNIAKLSMEVSNLTDLAVLILVMMTWSPMANFVSLTISALCRGNSSTAPTHPAVSSRKIRKNIDVRFIALMFTFLFASI